MTRTPEDLDPQIGIGAARQAAMLHRSYVSYHPAPQVHRPRKLLGFDLIRGLQDLAHSRVGQQYAYYNCAVQKDRDGNISQALDLNAMKVGNRCADHTLTG